MSLSKKKVVGALFILLCCYQAVLSQQQFDIKVYGFEDGLSHRNTFKVLQGPYGYLWVATINGLNRFDGTEFRIYSRKSKTTVLPDSLISDMIITPDSLLLLAFQNQLHYLDPETGKSALIRTDTNSILSTQNRTFSSLTMDNAHNIWTVAYNKRDGSAVLQESSNGHPLKDFFHFRGNYPNRPLLYHGEYLYAGMHENNLWRLTSSKEFEKIYAFPTIKDNLSHSRIIQLQTTSDQTLWALLDNFQLYYKTKDSKEFEKHPITNIINKKGKTTTFFIDEDKTIWIGGDDALFHFIPETKTLTNLDPAIRDIVKYKCEYRHIFEDISGVVWLSTDYGLVKIARPSQHFDTYLNEGNIHCDGFCSLRGITEDEEGNLYFSYYSSIHKLDKSTNTIRPLFSKTNFFNLPFGLLYFQGALWTGNGRRIDLLTQEVDTIFHASPSDKGVCIPDKDSTLWFGYAHTLFHYNPHSRTLRADTSIAEFLGHKDLDVSHLTLDKNNNGLWVGTNTHGLFHVQPDSGKVKQYTSDAENNGIRLSNNRILATYSDSNNLWIATANGLNRLEFSSGSHRVYTTNDGLPNNFINGILSEGDSCFWISTDHGLSRFSPATRTFVNFFAQDGLSANEFNRISFFKARDGRMYFGGMNGVNAFYPNQQFIQKSRRTDVPVLLSGFSKFDDRVDSTIFIHTSMQPGTPVTLSHRDKIFTFSFSLADFNNPEKTVYSHLLEGYEKEWSTPSENTTARYHNIPPGDYIFRVKASTGHNKWNQQELRVPLHIQQAWYTTWWVIALGLLILSVIVFSVFQYRIYKIEERKKVLEMLVEDRTAELMQEKQKTEELLLNILPSDTAEELKKYGKATARRHNTVSVLFSDFKGFTKISEHLTPEELVGEIDFCFRTFDKIIGKYQLEKIKTIGDAYMCAANIPSPHQNSAVNIVHAALEIQSFLKEQAQLRKNKGLPFFEARIGIHTGPVVSGIVGIKKFAYDIWGDTVNIASRMEDHGMVGHVNISTSTYHLVKDVFECEYRGKIIAKHKRKIDMYFVHGLKINQDTTDNS